MLFNLFLGDLALGLIVLNPQHVIGRRNIREKCYDNQAQAHHVKAPRLPGLFGLAKENTMANTSQGEEPEKQPY